MLWTNLVRYVTGEARLEEVAEHAAARARHEVWNRVASQIDPMSPAEARGYVRARSAAIVHREIDAAYRNDPTLGRTSRGRLIELTTESVIQIITDQVSFAQAIPMVQETRALLRRAA